MTSPGVLRYWPLMAAILSCVPLNLLRAEAIWTRWYGDWEVALDWESEGGTCYWSTYDTKPPTNARRLTFVANRKGEVVVMASDRREPLHRLAAGQGATLRLADLSTQ